MSVMVKDILMPADKDIIDRGDWLTDVHMDYFQRLLASCSDYRPVETWRIQLLNTIQPVWTLGFYNRKNIFIYDSLNNKMLHKQHELFLKKLFPTYEFDKNPVKFPKVQCQPNCNDCGVFAIAFATSLLFNLKPDKVTYDHKLMRSHLIKIFETNIIVHFPQDPQYVAQKVLPIAVIRAREAEAVRKRIMRQYQIKEQKLNQLARRYGQNLENKRAKRRWQYKQNLEYNRKKSEVCLSLDTKCETIDEKLCALCGKSRHTASSENYFIDSTYHNISLPQHLITNVEGQITNVLPVIEAKAKKAWLRDDNLCKIDPFLINCYEKVLQTISICTFKKIPELLQKIHKCTIKTNSNTKLGHTHSCYIDTTLCKAMFLPIYLLSPHFPKVRNINRLIYQLTNFYRKMLDLEKALTSADLEILNEIITLAEEKAKHMYRHEQTCISLSEKEIFSEFKNAFKAYTKRCMDTPRYACVSCERLCYKKNVSQFNKFKVQMAESPFIKDLMAYIEKHDIQPEYICDYCQRKFRDGVLPGYSVLNNLFAHNVPDEIASLKQYEKMLIQRAKAFQTIVKMGTVINKKLPQRQMVQKAKGRTFHLPLPLQETLNKLCKNTDPINKNHEIILVRGVPTNSKIIWEDIVDKKKYIML
ncbi:hypothetical protein ALC57_13321 [Trachymyrmex cornetzi]|uniref:Ubiquitin-like protease family profile domain-containing protein n=1 Tax=Trachymyrmex cornetzi TaxID=471704 RepID=A0A151IZF5_9HYME|nr:hypothetical protein ALC57_13321 [Trachymyrmex cornetzi]